MAVVDGIWDWLQAPQTTSQGVFGYLDSRWWLYDEMRQGEAGAPYRAIYPKGTITHAWRRSDGKLRAIFNTDSQTILCCEEDNFTPRVVFEGYAEYPRGCTLQDGMDLIVAAGSDGWLSGAQTPFDRESEEGPSMPKPKVTVIGWTEGPIYVGERITASAVFQNAVSGAVTVMAPTGSLAKEIISGGDPIYLEVVAYLSGVYHVTANAKSADGQTDQTGTPRIVNVLPAPPPPEPPKPQVVTEIESRLAIAFMDTIADVANRHQGYINARCAGLDHRAALIAYRDAVAAAIAALPVEGA